MWFVFIISMVYVVTLQDISNTITAEINIHEYEIINNNPENLDCKY